MALGKPFRIHTLLAPEKYSVLLTHRNKETALLFEANIVAELSMLTDIKWNHCR